MKILLDARSGGNIRKRATGGSSGSLLNLDMVFTSPYAVAYTVPVQVGSSQQNFSLQVDTGSSDLWIASKSCSSPACLATNGRLYDPSSAQPTGANLTMQYLSGTVSGPIVWDQVQIGDYTIPNQALAAATSVDNEPLSFGFDGVLGLSLPSNSLIQQTIPASTGNAPTGAAVSSNILSLTAAPSQPFFSLSLARPGSTQIPTLLGIGQHPSSIVPDPSQIRYSPLVSDSVGPLFWKTAVRAITVYVNGQAHPVELQTLSGKSEPTALLDSGIPLIVTTPALANGIYGALGIGPASDGNYYVPCMTPLNMTITLDDENEIPLHPLDLTAEPTGQSGSQNCTGLIQTNPSKLTPNSEIGDMILGVPFMRNVYTVMAYQQPDASGNFNNPAQLGTHPALGLLGLTSAAQAMEEFNQVRVLKQPLGSASLSSHGGLPIGVKVLIGLVGLFALCIAIFSLRCFFARKWRERAIGGKGEPGSDEFGALRGTRRSSMDQRTLVTARKDKFPNDKEFGARKSKLDDDVPEADMWDPWNPYAGTWRDTIIGTEAGEVASTHSSDSSIHEHPRANFDPASPHGSPELRNPLLVAHGRDDSLANEADEFGVLSGGMAGIGTAARGSIIDPDFQIGLPGGEGLAAGLRTTMLSGRSSSPTLVSPRMSAAGVPGDDAVGSVNATTLATGQGSFGLGSQRGAALRAANDLSDLPPQAQDGFGMRSSGIPGTPREAERTL